MTTLMEILDAAKQLPIGKQHELFVELRNILVKSSPEADSDDVYELPADFTEQLTQAFYEVKCHSLQLKAGMEL